jgi:dTDP-4-amino-4,6-dideoxygalactose transaminase
MNVPFSRPSIGEEEIEAVTRVMRSGWMAAGKETEAFEQEFSTYITPEGEEPYYCIFTNSGTAALKMAYKIMKVDQKRIIHYPKNTFCATYSAAVESGIEVIACYDASSEAHSTSEDATSRTVSVHYGGVKDYRPCYLEDSAHRIEPNDPLVGKIRIYSFYVTKNMTTGAGGMFVTNDKEIYDRARLYWRDGLTTSTHDRLTGTVGYEVRAMAGGYDGSDLTAAMGRVQLKRLPDFTTKRNEVRDRYNAAFGGEWMGNHLYPFFVDSEEQVGELIEHLKSGGVSASYHYPGTGWLGVSLPIFPDMTDDEVEHVISTVKEWKG